MGFLLLMQKLFNAFAAVSMVISIGTVGSGIFAYKWATNPTNQEKIKGQIIESVKGSLKIPGMTGGASAIGGKKSTGLGQNGRGLPF